MKLTLSHVSRMVLWVHLLAAALYGIFVSMLLHAQANPPPGSFPPMMCGNVLTDPLLAILNWATPVAFVSLVLLFIKRQHTEHPSRDLTIALIVFALPTIFLIAFGIWLFHGPLDGTTTIGRQVWWLFEI